MAELHSQPKTLLVNPSSKELEMPRNLNPNLEFPASNNKPHAQTNNGTHHFIFPFQKQNTSIIKNKI